MMMLLGKKFKEKDFEQGNTVLHLKSVIICVLVDRCNVRRKQKSLATYLITRLYGVGAHGFEPRTFCL